jgi:hypothetical protein
MDERRTFHVFGAWSGGPKWWARDDDGNAYVAPISVYDYASDAEWRPVGPKERLPKKLFSDTAPFWTVDIEPCTCDAYTDPHWKPIPDTVRDDRRRKKAPPEWPVKAWPVTMFAEITGIPASVLRKHPSACRSERGRWGIPDHALDDYDPKDFGRCHVGEHKWVPLEAIDEFGNVDKDRWLAVKMRSSQSRKRRTVSVDDNVVDVDFGRTA